MSFANSKKQSRSSHLKIFTTETASQPFKFFQKFERDLNLPPCLQLCICEKGSEKAPVQAGRYGRSKVGIKQWGLLLKARNSHRLHMHEPWRVADE